MGRLLGSLQRVVSVATTGGSGSKRLYQSIRAKPGPHPVLGEARLGHSGSGGVPPAVLFQASDSCGWAPSGHTGFTHPEGKVIVTQRSGRRAEPRDEPGWAGKRGRTQCCPGSVGGQAAFSLSEKRGRAELLPGPWVET